MVRTGFAKGRLGHLFCSVLFFFYFLFWEVMETITATVIDAKKKYTRNQDVMTQVKVELETGEQFTVHCFGREADYYAQTARRGATLDFIGKWQEWGGVKSFKVAGLPTTEPKGKEEQNRTDDGRGEHAHLPVQFNFTVYDHPADWQPRVTKYTDVQPSQLARHLRTYQAGDRYYIVYKGKRPVAKIERGEKVFHKQIDEWEFHDALNVPNAYEVTGTLEWHGQEWPRYEPSSRKDENGKTDVRGQQEERA